jgi:hypothetical protein
MAILVVPIENVCPVVARVPLVGNVTLVAADTVNVVPKFPLIVIVLAALFATPVPPEAGLNVADKPPAVPETVVCAGWTWSALATVVPVPIAAVPATTGVVELKPVILLKLVPVATPIDGVVNVGLVANTRAPEPVSSDITPANWDDVVAANCDRFPVLRATVPVVAGRVNTVPVPAIAVGII